MIHISRFYHSDSYEFLMVHHMGVQLRRDFMVKYVRENSVDMVGVFIDYVLNLSQAFSINEIMFEPFGDHGCCIAREVAGQKTIGFQWLFRFFGRFIGLVMFHGMTMDFQLSRQLVKLIQNQDLDLNDIASDSGLHAKLEATLDPNMDEETWEDLYDNWSYPVRERSRKPTLVAFREPHEVKSDVSMADRHEYAHKMIQLRIGRGQWVINSIRQGIGEVFPIEWLDFFTTDELQQLICGSEKPLDVDEWERNTYYHPTATLPDSIKKYFWRWIREDATDEDRRDVSLILDLC